MTNTQFVKRTKEKFVAMTALFREGYGVEDIARKLKLSESIVREHLAFLRRNNKLVIDPPEWERK